MVREGYFRREEQVTVNEASAVSWVLKPRLGGLDIVARDTMGNDVTSRVFVDGKFVGTCPGVLQIVMGTHSVRVEAPTGFWVGEITVLENQVTRKSVDLTGVSVRLSSEPLGATMTINGKRYASPARAELPETGNYTVTAKYRGYPPQVRAAAISQYGEKTVHIDLTDKIYTALVMAEFTTNKGYHWSIYHLFHPFKDDVFCLGVRTAFGETYYDRVQSQGGHQNVEFLYMTYTAATAMLGILWRKDNDFLVGVLLEYGGFIPTHRFLKLTENTHVTDFQIEPHFGGFKTLIGGEARWGLNGGIVFGHTVFPPAKVSFHELFKVTIHEAQDWPSGVNSFTVGGFLGWHW
jgi:hypothetical protein